MAQSEIPYSPDDPDLARALFEEAGDALFLVDPASGLVLDANPVAERLSKYRRDEMRGMATSYLFRHESQGGTARLRQALHHTDLNLLGLDGYLLRTKPGGVWIPVSVAVSRLHLAARSLGLITARDQRDQRAMLNKLRQLESEWRQVLSSVSDCLWSAEISSAGQWSYHYISPVIEVITGRPPSYFLADRARWHDLVHPDDRDTVVRGDRELRLGHRHETVREYRLARPDGQYAWLRDSVRARSIHSERRLDGVVSDVTERRRADDALRRSEERFRTLVEKSTDVISLIDDHGRILYASPSVQSVIGRPPEALLGTSGFDYLDPEETDRLRRLLARCVQEPERDFPVQFRLSHGDGTWRDCEGVIRNRLNDPDIRAVVVTYRDITDRRRSEVALRESERRFRDTIENARLVGVWLDREGKIVFCNDALLRLTGYRRAEVLGQDWFALFIAPPQRLSLLRQFREGIERGELPFHHENDMLTKQGEARLIAWNNTILRSVDGLTIGASSLGQDITDRRRAEEALRDSEARYRDLFEFAPIGFWEEDFREIDRWMQRLRRSGVTDLRAHLREHPDQIQEALRLIRIIDVNQETLNQTGAVHKADLFHQLPYLFDDEATPAFTEELAALWEGLDDFEYESRGRRLDGGNLDLLLRLHVPRRQGRRDLSRVIITCTDISARRRAEEMVEGQRALLQGIIDSIPDLISRKDDRGVYQDGNAAFAHFVGQAAADLVGKTDADLFAHDVAHLLTEADQLVLSGGNAERLEFWATSADQRRILLETLRVPLTDRDQQRLGLIGISRDITQRRQLEEQLRQAGKLEAVGQLAGGIAHDFNNLLTAIVGNLSLAQQQLPAHDPVRELLGSCETAANRAAELTRQLLSFARKTSVHLAPLDLNAVVRETVAILRRTIDPRIAIEVRLAPKLGTVLADLGQISQVLFNLCLNARDAMPEGGRLVLATAEATFTPEDAAQDLNAQPGEFLQLTVEDTGHGIPPEIQDRIFEPFFTTKELGQGTGLGLALVHGIVHSHGGWIQVASFPRQGTRFEIYLPRVSQPPIPVPSEPAPPVQAAPAAAAPAQAILLVDDEPLIRSFAQLVLETHGYQVRTAVDGQEAVEIYRRDPTAIDLVILDLSMPRMNGRDACRAIVRLDPEARILLSSGYSSEQEASLREPCVLGFVPKPYRPSELLHAVAAALAAPRAQPPSSRHLP